MLPTELEAIKIHAERPVLGKDSSEKVSNKTKSTAKQPVNNLSGGYTG